VKINKDLSEDERQLLEKQGVVFPEDGGDPFFAKKEAPVPAGMRRLSTGTIVRYQPIEEVLTNNR